MGMTLLSQVFRFGLLRHIYFSRPELVARERLIGDRASTLTIPISTLNIVPASVLVQQFEVQISKALNPRIDQAYLQAKIQTCYHNQRLQELKMTVEH